ncbi:MAG: hypothetical protein GY906_29125, partial [bacterium]|nr:hypothetical protein [bacterium]
SEVGGASSIWRKLDVGEGDPVLAAIPATAASDQAASGVAVVVHRYERDGLAEHVNVDWKLEGIHDAQLRLRTFWPSGVAVATPRKRGAILAPPILFDRPADTR